MNASDCEDHAFPTATIDYDAVIPFKHRLLEAAWHHFRDGARLDLSPDFQKFCADQAHWLEDYALFRKAQSTGTGARVTSNGRRSWSGAIPPHSSAPGEICWV